MKKYLVIFIVITLHLSSCSDTNIRYDYCVSVVQNNIVISTNNPSKSVITIQRELSPSGRRVYISNGVVTKFSIRDSVILEVRNKDSINILNLLMRSHNKMNIACEFAKLNKIAWRISNSSTDTVTSHINTEDIILFSESVKVIMPKHIPNISGLLRISTNSFIGNHVNFEFSSFENSDIESVSIKREIHRDYMKWSLKQETKVIKLSDKKSPYHFTYELDLGIGDNFIPITVTDKRGNKTEYTYKISMVRVEDNNPDINIDNNIDIYQ